MPIGAYSGLNWTGDKVSDIVSNSSAQVESVLAMRDHLDSQVLLTAMDLSAEAEAFGAQIHLSADEIPTIIGRLVTSSKEIEKLKIPAPGDKRTRVHLAAAQKLASLGNGLPVLGGMIGPFSLAGRLFGVSELLEATASDEVMVMAILEKVTDFLKEYAESFRDAGAVGVIMAEPTAGLISPKSLARFSAPYVRRIVESTQTESFTPILHNCGAKLAHLEKTFESGASIYHFGAFMDLPAALDKAGSEVILCGNIDPAGVFFNGTEENVRSAVRGLLQEVGSRKNFILSSGCDIPPGTPLRNIEIFIEEGRK